MSTPVFFIRDYINNYPNLEAFRAEIYKKNILSKDYVEDNLFLIYHKYDQPTNSDMDRECRSIVMDRNTKQIISFSCETPLVNSEALEYLLLNQQQDKLITKCYEGTLLSVFSHGQKWYVSTRRCLNSEESTWGTISHNKMFMEVLNNSGYETFDSFTTKLNKNYCYYFVLIHHQNKNVVDYENELGKEYKKLCLVFLRDKETQREFNLYEDNNLGVNTILDSNIFLSEKINSLEDFDTLNKKDQFNLPPKSEGVVIRSYDTKLNRYRLLKLQTMGYQFAKSVGSDKNIFMGLIHLYQNGKLVEFINQSQHLKKIVNPLNLQESYDTIGTIDALFKVCTSELFELFKIIWDIKSGKHLNEDLYKHLPKEYKDVLYTIRGIYYKKKSLKFSKEKLSEENYKNSYLQIKDIYSYLKTLSTENFCALLKMRRLMFNWTKVNTEISDFMKMSTKCDKVHFKLTAIYTNKLFPTIMPEDLPPLLEKKL